MSRILTTPKKTTTRPYTGSPYSLSAKKRLNMKRIYKRNYQNKLHLNQSSPFQSIYNSDFKKHKDLQSQQLDFNVNKHQ